MIHDKVRVDAIRVRMKAQIELIRSLQAKIVKGKLDMLDLALQQTEDVETLYLRELDRHDRSAPEEARWLSFAEHYLQTWVPYLKQTEEQFTKFGGHGIEVVPSR